MHNKTTTALFFFSFFNLLVTHLLNEADLSLRLRSGPCAVISCFIARQPNGSAARGSADPASLSISDTSLTRPCRKC